MIIDEHAKIVLVTKSGDSYTIPESGIVKNTLSTSHSCSNSGGIPAGSCNAGTMSVSIKRPYGLSYRSLFGAKLHLYVWYGSHSEELRGVYTLTSVTRNGNVLNISASDNVQLLDSSCYGAQDVQDAINGLLAILGSGNHTPAYIFNAICNAYSIPHLTQAENIEIIPEAGNISPGNLSTTIPQESPTESIRDFAQALAEYVGGFICAYEDGRLGFCRLGARVSDIVLDSTNIGMGTFQRAPYFVVPDRWRVTFDSGFWSGWEVTSDLPEGAAPLTMEVQNNLFWQAIEDTTPGEFLAGKVTEMVKHPWQYLRGAAQKDGVYRIHPFSATVYVPHLFRAGDLVTIKDPETGEKFQSYITDVTWSFKRGQNVSCAGSDTRTLSVQKSRNSAKKSNDYSKYLYRKTKSGSGSGDTVSITRYQTSGTKIATFTVSGTSYDVYAPSSPTAVQIQQWTEAAEKAHTHSNGDVLDDITAPYTVEEKEKLAGLHGRYLPLAGGTMDANAGVRFDSIDIDTGELSGNSIYIGGNVPIIRVHHKYRDSNGNVITGYFSELRGDGLHLDIGNSTEHPSAIWFDGSVSGRNFLLGSFDDGKLGIYEMLYDHGEAIYTERVTFEDSADFYVKIKDNLIVDGMVRGDYFRGANASQSEQGLMSAVDKTKLDSIEEGANKYTHPSYTARASGLYKITVDATGHVSAIADISATDVSMLINKLSTGASTPADADYYICQYAGGGTTTTTYHRRPMSALWEYIKSKISSVLGLTASTYGGNAATATQLSDYLTIGGAQQATYILISTVNISTWSHYFGVYAIKSRHTGTGILVIELGCENSTVSFSNVNAQCIYYGSDASSRINENSFQIYASSDGKKAYVFARCYDYSSVVFRVLHQGGVSISAGASMTSIDTSTYGTKKCGTTIVGTSFSGNSSSATKVQSKVTKPTTQATYYPDFHPGLSDGVKELLHSGGNRLVLIEGTASTEGLAIHVLGDSTKSGTAENKTGVMRLYGYSGFYGQFKPSTGLTGNRTYTLPDKSGTVAMTSDLPSDSGWKNLILGSTGQVRYRKIGGMVEVRGQYKPAASTGGATIGTLPDGYRPTSFSAVTCLAPRTTDAEPLKLTVYTTGEVLLSGNKQGAVTGGTTYDIDIMFMI